MYDSERRAKLNQILLTVQAVLADQSLTKRIHQEQGGFGSTDMGKLTSRSLGSPVEALVGLSGTAEDEANDAGWRPRPDIARNDLSNFDRIVDKMYDLARGTDDKDGLDQIRRRYPPFRRADFDEFKNDKGEPGCQLCAREKKWNQPLGDPTDVPDETGKPILQRKYLLCSTCATLVANINGLPRPDQWRAVHETGKAKVKAR